MESIQGRLRNVGVFCSCILFKYSWHSFIVICFVRINVYTCFILNKYVNKTIWQKPKKIYFCKANQNLKWNCWGMKYLIHDTSYVLHLIIITFLVFKEERSFSNYFQYKQNMELQTLLMNIDYFIWQIHIVYFQNLRIQKKQNILTQDVFE